QGMKKLVWSEASVEGGRPFRGALAKPPSTTGPFQNIPDRGFAFGPPEQASAPKPRFYADAAVVAFRAPEDDRPLAEIGAKVPATGGKVDLAALTDGAVAKPVPLPVGTADQPAWIQFGFPRPETVRAVTLVAEGARNPFASDDAASGQELQSSDD